MKLYKKKMVETEVIIGHKCEVCKKVVKTEKEIFGFHANHQDYEESYFNWYEVCSWKCFMKKLPEIYGGYKEFETTDICNMPLFIIKQILNKSLYKFEHCIHNFKVFTSSSNNLLKCKKCGKEYPISEIKKVSEHFFLSLKENRGGR